MGGVVALKDPPPALMSSNTKSSGTVLELSRYRFADQ